MYPEGVTCSTRPARHLAANHNGRGGSVGRIVKANCWFMTHAIDKSPDRVRQMFGAIAPNYDRLNHFLSLNVDRYWRGCVVRKLAPRPGEPILDVCTGTADLAIAFWRKTGGRCPIVGADFCPEMLAVGRKKQRQLEIGENHLRLIEADAQALPLDDDSFQLVTVAFGLRNIADPRQGLREMVRVCRRGGTVAVLEFSLPRHQPIKFLYGWYFRHILPRVGRLASRQQPEAYQYLPESVGQFPSYEQLAQWLRDAGLSDVRFQPLTFGIATLYWGSK
jgi:demethylmenaquinone methyltransferase/2-methoxy-6-polyprenyl-1,4-benzoquinol methylase